MSLQLTLQQIIHVHEFYLMFSFKPESIGTLLQDIERQGLSYQEALREYPFLQDYHDSLRGECLYSLTRKTVEYQFDDLCLMLQKNIGHEYVYRASQGGEQSK